MIIFDKYKKVKPMSICDKGLTVFISRYQMNYYLAYADSLPGALVINSVPYFEKMKCKLMHELLNCI